MRPYSYREDENVPDFDDAQPFVVFDGVCHFCSRSMRIVFEHEKQPIHFVPTQSELGRTLLNHYGLNADDPASFIFIDQGKARFSSSGVFALSGELKGWPALMQIFWIMPRPITDWFYGVFARNRYNWFGKSEVCMVPSPDMKNRLIDFPDLSTREAA
jgi:predicted DCC family thiol-disulfide oxidoreductase YuxK